MRSSDPRGSHLRSSRRRRRTRRPRSGRPAAWRPSPVRWRAAPGSRWAWPVPRPARRRDRTRTGWSPGTARAPPPGSRRARPSPRCRGTSGTTSPPATAPHTAPDLGRLLALRRREHRELPCFVRLSAWRSTRRARTIARCSSQLPAGVEVDRVLREITPAPDLVEHLHGLERPGPGRPGGPRAGAGLGAGFGRVCTAMATSVAIGDRHSSSRRSSGSGRWMSSNLGRFETISAYSPRDGARIVANGTARRG